MDVSKLCPINDLRASLRYRNGWQAACATETEDGTSLDSEAITTGEHCSMENSSFYDDHKFCPECDDYVAYLISMDNSYCVTCGGIVRLFSEDDWTNFNESLKSRRPKGGRPRKNKGDEGKKTA